MNREEKLKALSLNTIDHLTIVADKANNFKHEVFNNKSPHYLEFEYFQADEEAPQGLIVLVKTTHGFRITRNEGLYMPSMLVSGLDSLVKPFNVPIKPAHRDSAGNLQVEPIGRVIGGQYIHQIPFGNIGFDSRAAATVDPDTPEGISLIRQAMLKGPLLDDDFEGLGYVLTKGLITDTEAIKKILDGRYLTVSVELRTDKWINPVTGNSWLDDIEQGDIDYFIGDMVDGIRAIKVANRIKYDAYAFVTHPADEEALVIGHKLVQGEEFERIRNQFGSTMMMIDSTASSNFSDKEVFDSVQGVKPGYGLRGKQTFSTSQGDSTMKLKELLESFKKSCLKGETFDKAEELYDALSGRKDFKEVSQDERISKQFFVSGLPLVPEVFGSGKLLEVFDETQPEEAKLLTRFEVLKELVEEISTVTNQDDKVCDNDNKVGSENVNNNNEDLGMDKEQILNALSADENLRKAILADLDVVSKSKLDEIASARDEAQSQISSLEKAVVEANAKRDIYKETVQDSMEEVVELRHSLASATKDHRETIENFATILTALTEKEFDGRTVTMGSKSLKECLEVLDSLSEALNIEEARKSLFDLVAGKPSQKIPDPTQSDDIEDPSTQDGVSSDDDVTNKSEKTYSALEINVAKKWKMFMEDGKIGNAKNLLSTYKRRNHISMDFDPTQVIESLKD